MKKSSRLILIALLFTLNTATFGQGPALDTKGQWVATKPSGCQAFTWFEGNVQMEWTGGCKNGRLNGVGSLRMFDEGVSVISGELSYTEGRAEGRGDLKYTNLGTYVGEFKNSKFNGIGVFTLQDGRKIVGEFKEGDPDGKAIEYNPDGSISDSGIYEKGKLITSQYIDPKIFQRVTTGTVVVEGKRVSAASSDVVANWIQDKTTGCKTFNPSPSPEHSVKIIGNCADGYLQGQGVVIWYRKDKQSAKSEGFYLKGKLAGQGVETYPDGRKYVGEFKESDYNGQGTLTFADGTSYVGEFKDGRRNGQGTYTFTSGAKYIGGFKDGKYAGQGTYTSADGSKYIGEFKDNKYNGQGTLYGVNGGVSKSGIWSDDELVTPEQKEPKIPHRVNTEITPGNSEGPNNLEKLLNIGYGTKQMIDDFQDDGGLSKENTWLGLPVYGVITSYSRGVVSGFALEIDYFITANQIKSITGKYCEVSSWQREKRSTVHYTGKGSRCNVMFSQSLRSEGLWDVIVDTKSLK